MISVNWMANLGNNMFQWAVDYAVCMEAGDMWVGAFYIKC
jgi:hypothetical protein